MEEASIAPTLDKDYFNNVYCGMDDWVYEMRREIQEIVVSTFLVKKNTFHFLTT